MMFKFLKKKIKDAVSSFSKSASEDVEELSPEELTKEQEQKLVQEEKLVEQETEEESESVQEVEPEPEQLEIVPEEKDIPEEDFSEQEQEEQVQKKTIKDEQDLESEIEKEAGEKQELKEAPVKEAKPEEVKQEVKEDTKQELKEVTHEEKVQEELKDESVEEIASEPVQDLPEEKKEKKSFLSKLFKKKNKEDDFDLVEKEESELEEEVKKEHELKEAPVKEESEPEEKVKAEHELKEIPVNEIKPKEKVKEELASEQFIQSEPKFPEYEEAQKEKVESPVPRSSKPVKEAVHKELLQEDVKDSTKKKKGFFGKLREKVVKFQLTDEKFEELFWDLELALLENNVAVEVIEKIKQDLKVSLTQEQVSRRSIENIMISTLKSSLEEVLDVPTFDFISRVKSKKPYVICVVGVNGSGKTTTIAKIIHLLQKKNLSVVVAAADTFRAAAIQQIEEHTKRLGVKLIKHDYNADPSAVAFDAIKHATAKNIDVVLIDTAGRLQSNSNLMDELKKLVRVNKPDMNLFIGESITGNDCVQQAVAFNEAVGIDAIILSKADVDDKGGAAISVSYVSKKPILYLGTGQTYDDLTPYKKELILDALGL